MIVTLHRREKPPDAIQKACYWRAEAESGRVAVQSDWDGFCRRYGEMLGRWIFRDAIAWLARREDFEVLAVTVAGVGSGPVGPVGYPMGAMTASIAVRCAGVDAAVLFKLARG